MIKRLLLGLLALVLLLAAVLVANTLRQGSRQVPAQPVPDLAVDKAAVAESMAIAVRAKTVSGLLDPAGVAAEFDALHAHLKTRYPLVHEKLQREVVGGHSLLFTWKGSDDKLPPVALMAHQDVVPIAPGTESLWKKPPFAGAIEEGFVWGRGTLDDKSNLITQLEALELLLKAGFTPKRTLYFVYGHDEEVGGRLGVVKIVEQLKQRGVKLAWVMDEGLAVTEGILPGVKQPLALIGLAEKGSVSLKLVATAPPGHSSTPPAKGESAIGRLSAALARLDQQPMPGGIQGAAAEMFAALAPDLPFGQRLAMSNLWLLRPVVERALDKGGATSAMLRTTTAMTVLNAGNKGKRAAGPCRGHRQLPHPARRHGRVGAGACQARGGRRAHRDRAAGRGLRALQTLVGAVGALQAHRKRGARCVPPTASWRPASCWPGRMRGTSTASPNRASASCPSASPAKT